MIDQIKKQKAEEQKEKVRKRIKTQIDPNAYAFIPAKKQVDYYDNDIQQRVAVYARVSTDNIQQKSSPELCVNSLSYNQATDFLEAGLSACNC